MVPEKQSSPPLPPALFREVGPLVEDWEKYLRDMAEGADNPHSDTSTGQEDIDFLQVHRLVINFHHDRV